METGDLLEEADEQEEQGLAAPNGSTTSALPSSPGKTNIKFSLGALVTAAAKPPKPLELVLQDVELQKLHKLDVANQNFQATIWMEFVVPGGMRDEFLVAGMHDRPPAQVFPLNDKGRPLFRPSATWYIAQVDCRNALSWRVVDAKVMPRDEDIVMAIRVEGVFTEVYELVDYPFDVQGLNMTLVFNCRANGPLPIDIQIKPGVHVSLTCIHLCPPNREYDVVEELYIRPHLVGTGDRTFPGISFTAKVKRHPFYHIVYAAVPMGIFALIAVLTSASRKIENLNHRAHLNMILVLTAATYRVASARQLPPINYFTALDYYTLANVTFIIIAAIWSRVQMLRYGELPASTYEALGIPSGEYTGFEDLVVTFALSAAWLIAQVAFAILGPTSER